MHVVAFTGMPGSGKSAAVALAQDEGIPVVRMGDFIMQEIEARGLIPSEENIAPVATGMREELGPDIWARRTITAIEAGQIEGMAEEPRLVVVDGVRSQAEIDRFRADLGTEFVLVAITCDDALRHERIRERGRSDDATELDQVRARDERELGWGIQEAIEAADITLDNDTTLEAFEAKAHALFEELRQTADARS